MKKFLLYLIIITLFFSTLPLKARAIEFDPSNIISDQEILDSTTMNLDDIQKFLESKNSYLANYKTENFDGLIKSAAEIIHDAAFNNYYCDKNVQLSENPTQEERRQKCRLITINPKFLIVLLQKEQSLIEGRTPTPRQLDWATGYGCPDNQACNLRWQGFGKQVNSAALQFYDYLINPQRYRYKVGETYIFSNPTWGDIEVTPANHATAALYNYTPHVYNGNFNFWRLWHRYFTIKYPNGSLLQTKGEDTVWLIQNNKKRAFLSKGALYSRYDPNRIIAVNKSDLDAYSEGVPIKFPQYSLLRAPQGTVYLLVDDVKRGFASQEALRTVGINPEEIIDASWEDLNLYKEGRPITAVSSYAGGALLQDKTTGGIYWATDTTKAPLLDAVFLRTKFKNKPIIPTNPEKLQTLQTIEPVIFEDGYLISPDDASSVYVIENRQLRPIASAEVFVGLGYKWENIIQVPRRIIGLYTFGQPIDQIFESEINQSKTNE